MFITKFVVCGAIASIVNAASLTNTAADFSNIKAGQPFTINWSGANGPVTLLLKDGPSNNLKTVKTIASGLSGNSFTWTPEASLPKEQYAIEIQDASGPNYSVQFPISGSSASASTPDHAHQVSSSVLAPAATGSYLPSSGYVSYTSAHSNGTTLTSSPVYTSTPYPSYTPSVSANTTESQTSETKTHTPTHTSATPSPSDTNNAADVTSPVAFVFLAFAAFVFLQ